MRRAATSTHRVRAEVRAGWIYVLIGPAMFVLARLHRRGAAFAAAPADR